MVSVDVGRYHRRMRKTPVHVSIPTALLLMASVSARAEDARCQPSIEAGWIRLGPSAMPMMAGFAKAINACKAPVSVVAVSSPAFAEVSMHETLIEDDVSRMREVAALRLGAGETAVLAPGAMHLMLMQPTVPLKAGDAVVLKWKLQDGREVLSEFVVRRSAP